MASAEYEKSNYELNSGFGSFNLTHSVLGFLFPDFP